MSENTWTQHDDCAPNCSAEHAEDEACNPCPNPRCIDHSAGYCGDYCQQIHCTGHDEYGDCTEGHAAWCPGDAARHFGSACEMRLGGGVEICTELSDGATLISGGDIDATDLARVDAAIAGLQTAREYLRLELEHIAARQQEYDAWLAEPGVTD